MSYIGNGLTDIQINRYEYTATSGQTVFNCTYDHAVDVYLNGVRLAESDFTATTGTSITLATGATAGDIVTIAAYYDITNGDIDAVAPAQAGNAGKFLTTDGTNASWGDTLYESGGNVGIGTGAPDYKLDVYNGQLGNTAGDKVKLLQLYNNTTNNSYLNFYSLRTADGTNWTTSATRIQQVTDNTEQGYIQFNGHDNNYGISFGRDNTERMRIDSSGYLKFDSGYGSAATAYGCRAWVNFNGTGTVAIRASGNVSSITDNGTGRYTVNFSTAMPDASYSTIASMKSGLTNGVAFSSTMSIASGGSYSTTAVSVEGVPAGDVGGYTGQAVNDSPTVCVAIFR